MVYIYIIYVSLDIFTHPYKQTYTRIKRFIYTQTCLLMNTQITPSILCSWLRFCGAKHLWNYFLKPRIDPSLSHYVWNSASQNYYLCIGWLINLPQNWVFKIRPIHEQIRCMSWENVMMMETNNKVKYRKKIPQQKNWDEMNENIWDVRVK